MPSADKLPHPKYELTTPASWSAEEKEIIDTAVGYIDNTFKNSPTGKLRIGLVYEKGVPHANGSFDPDTGIIRVSTSPHANLGIVQAKALTFTHEWAHALDFALGQKAGTSWASLGSSAESAAWLAEVMSSPSYRSLMQIRSKNSSYFRSTHECFSRCMEMMMAKRLGTKSMAALDEKRRAWKSQGLSAYWEWSEFDSILRALEAWLRAEGVLQ